MNNPVIDTELPGADILGQHYRTVALADLPSEQAKAFILKLFEENERFFKGFYWYWAEVLGLSHDEAMKNTREEVQGYIDAFMANLADPRYQTLGYIENDEYHPVGLFGFSFIEEHPIGPELLKTFEAHADLKERFQGRLAIAHAMSMLEGHRHRHMLLYSFSLIALRALDNDVEHIFFFASDHRLKRVYQRLGLEFPENLKLPETKHLVGNFSLTPQNIELVYETSRRIAGEGKEIVTQNA